MSRFTIQTLALAKLVFLIAIPLPARPAFALGDSPIAISIIPDTGHVRAGEPISALVSVVNQTSDPVENINVSCSWTGSAVLRVYASKDVENAAPSPAAEDQPLPIADLDGLQPNSSASWFLYGVANKTGTIELTVVAAPVHLDAMTAIASIEVVAAHSDLGTDDDPLATSGLEDLEPLGRNVHGLWEYWMPSTGAEPVLVGDRYVIDGDTAMIFVLIPTEKHKIGSHTNPSIKDYYCAVANDDEMPLCEFYLDPYLISKYEMTQGQWKRATSKNPSILNELTKSVTGVDPITKTQVLTTLPPRPLDSNPVEGVSWIDCVSVLEALGLTLPTEAQWEVAARARNVGAQWTYEPYACVGKEQHVAVDFGTPNQFGLYHVLGNVSEWCADGYFHYSTPTRPADGLRGTGASDVRIARGGSNWSPPNALRSAARSYYPPDTKQVSLGCRPVRLLTR